VLIDEDDVNGREKRVDDLFKKMTNFEKDKKP
jgi:hypothetical protein